jgi:tripartite-type tricarboxylate transporter receptor subunit TctC
MFVAGSAAVALSRPARAASFPTKAIHLVVPYAPGGATDFSARIIGEGMNKKLGQPVVIENRPGASQMIGMEYVARAQPDGYTLIMASEDATALLPYLRSSMPYQMPDAFTYISRATLGSYMICINPNRPYKTIQEFVAYAKANPPNTIKYATAGPGTAGDIAAYIIEEATGIKMLHVAYKGGAPSLVDTIAGVTDAVCQSYSGVAEHSRAGRVRLMVCTGPTRNPLAPEVPTLTDLGHPNATLTNWLGILGPGGIPQDVQVILQNTVADVLREPEVRDKFLKVAFDPTPVVGEEFRQQVIGQMAKWKAFAEKTGLRID